MPLTLLPSPTKAAVAWAKAQPDLAALVEGRVGTKLGPRLPAIRVQVVGGDTPETWEGQPVLQWDCWAATEGEADMLARTLVAALPEFRGVFDGGRVHTFVVESGPFWSPDDPNLSNNSRYIVTTRLVTTTG